MTGLQTALQKQIAELPKLALRRVLKRKLGEQEISLPPVAFDALVDHLLSHKGEHFIWDDGKEGEAEAVNLVFDEHDAAHLQELSDHLIKTIPQVVKNIVANAGTDVFKTLVGNWSVEGAVQRFEVDAFRDRLEDRWGNGLQLLRMLLTIVRELGHETVKRYRRSHSKKHAHRRFVLVRLHMRACQVTEEIITLMENGFADGAMARWRTLHELDVVATLIGDGDEELAKRYINHDAVEVKKQADEYDRTLVPLGYSPISSGQRKKITKDYDETIRRYGKPFGTDYGWAATRLNKSRPTFQDLQSAARQSGMNSHYKLANWNVHAGARTMFFRLTNMGTNIPIAGRSNAGLCEPGQNAAYTLARITCSLFDSPRDLDQILELKTIIEVRDAVHKALNSAEKKLQRDEARARRDRKCKASDRRRKN